MAAVDTLKLLPTRGRDLRNLFIRPRKFALAWRDLESSASNKEVLAWALAFTALILSLYSATTGRSVLDAVTSALPVQFPATVPSGPAPKPTIGGWGWQIGAGLGVTFPEQKGLDVPQTVVFEMGAGQVSILHVIPAKFGTKVSILLLLNLYIYSLALCLYPGFRVWRTGTSFKRVVALVNLYVGGLWVFGSTLVTIAAIVLVNILKLHGWNFYFAYVAIVLLPVCVLAVRAFWASFRAISGLSRTKFIASLFVAWLISWIVFPVLAPLIFVVLRFQSFLDAVL